MTSNKDQIVGRAKQAAGDLTGNDDLHDEGETQESAGKAKEFIDDAGDKVEEGVDDLREKFDS